MQQGSKFSFARFYLFYRRGPSLVAAEQSALSILFTRRVGVESRPKNNLSEHRTILCSFLIAFTVVRADCCRVIRHTVSISVLGKRSREYDTALQNLLIYLLINACDSLDSEFNSEEASEYYEVERSTFLKSGLTKRTIQFLRDRVALFSTTFQASRCHDVRSLAL